MEFDNLHAEWPCHNEMELTKKTVSSPVGYFISQQFYPADYLQLQITPQEFQTFLVVGPNITECMMLHPQPTITGKKTNPFQQSNCLKM
jgi:hypothetical protein